MLQVEAVKDGFYGVSRVRKGQQFQIQSEAEFSREWMKPMGWVPRPKPVKGADGKAAGPGPEEFQKLLGQLRDLAKENAALKAQLAGGEPAVPKRGRRKKSQPAE